MPYSAQIRRQNPTALLFLVDQSGSMGGAMSTGSTKAQFVADVLNRTLTVLVTRCQAAGGEIRDYFYVGVLAYNGNGVTNGFNGPLSSAILQPISAIANHPLRLEKRNKKMSDGAGGIIEEAIDFPVWFDSIADGGTPMCAALTSAAQEIAQWSDQNSESYPPTIINVTDGAATDGNPEEFASKIKTIQTNDGNLLLLNLHVSDGVGSAITFPDSESNLPDEYAKMLFRMSSNLPQALTSYARTKGYTVGAEAKGFMYNADATDIVQFFDIGTKAAQA